jgi:hypothetical protein
MTSIPDVETVWSEKIFQHEDLLAISSNVIDHEYRQDSNAELEELYQEGTDGIGRLNFWEYVITKAEEVTEVGGQSRPQYQFNVDVQYTLEQDVAGTAQKIVVEAIETLCGLVRSELGGTWSTLDAKIANQVTPEPVQKDEINGTTVLRQAVRFTAFIQ